MEIGVEWIAVVSVTVTALGGIIATFVGKYMEARKNSVAVAATERHNFNEALINHNTEGWTKYQEALAIISELQKQLADVRAQATKEIADIREQATREMASLLSQLNECQLKCGELTNSLELLVAPPDPDNHQ